MNILLILLFLLVVATLFSRQRNDVTGSDLLITPALLIVGVIVSPKVLNTVLPSTIDSMRPALRVAIFWVPFLIGLRVVEMKRLKGYQSSMLWSLFLLFLGPLLCAFFATLSMYFLTFLPIGGIPEIKKPIYWVSMGLILGGIISPSGFQSAREMLSSHRYERPRLLSLFLHKFDGMFAILFCLAGLLILESSALYIIDTPQSLMPPLIGLLLAICVRLIIDLREDPGVSGWLTLLGLATLGAGLTLHFRSSEAIAGFVFGAALAPLYRTPIKIEKIVNLSQRPLRLVIAVLAGFMLEWSEFSLILGFCLFLLRIVAKKIINYLVSDTAESRTPLTSDLSFSSLSVPLAVSIFLNDRFPFDISYVLMAVVVVAVASDLLTAFSWQSVKEQVRGGVQFSNMGKETS